MFGRLSFLHRRANEIVVAVRYLRCKHGAAVFPPPWSVEELDACFVGRVKKHAVADQRFCDRSHVAPQRVGGRYDDQFIKLRRALGIIAGTKVVTTMTILWSAL
jgi:hypothetical protein